MTVFTLLVLSLLSLTGVFGNNVDIVGRQTTTTGDKKCGQLMCIAATVNGSTVEYVLSSRGTRTLGWMGMGFGRQMANTPMVIMWPNSDGSITLSQRTTPREAMPTLDSNPPRIATLSTALSSTSGSTPSLVYTIPANSDTTQSVIYAFGTVAPSSSTNDATLVQHEDYGTLQLNLAKSSSTSTSSGSSTTSSSSPGSSEDGSSESNNTIPLLPFERLIVAHAIFSTVGFLLLLPAGALLARYLRTFTPTWFTGHWIAQFGLAGPVIVTGIALGIQSVVKAGALHLNDKHKKWGITLFVLYIVQCGLGAFIHWVKSASGTRRPPQNYGHAVLGLLIIGLALFQVHSGFDTEWPKTTGRQDISNGVNVFFYIWVAVLPLAYAIGLSFLPKQFKQEKKNTLEYANVDRFNMAHRGERYRDHGN